MEEIGREVMESVRLRLPVSGETVLLQPPTGAEDLRLMEAWDSDTEVALALATRLTRRLGQGADVAPLKLDWREMPITDLDALILRFRQRVIGDRVRSDVICGQPNCGRRIEISFTISEYLKQHQPRKPSLGGAWQLDVAEEPGWYRLSERTCKNRKSVVSANTATCANEHEGIAHAKQEIHFRLPIVSDQLAMVTLRNGEAAREFARRCLRPAEAPVRLRRRAETVMEAMSPALSSELTGTCPECGSHVAAYFDARRFCIRELRERAFFIYQDIDVLARRYHWSEKDILALPHTRRATYAEFARQECAPI